jgi:nitroreductase
MVIDQILTARFSCRAFRSEQLDDALIRRIVGIAQKTASWCNTQPWRLIITLGESTERFREAMYDHASRDLSRPDFRFPTEYRGVYLQRRRECGSQLYSCIGIERGDKQAYRRQARENFRFYGAPHVAIITTDETLGVYGAIDCGAFVSNFMMAATSLGVASIAQAAIASDSAFVRNYFALPASRLIVCGISFGYGDGDAPANQFRTSRAAFDEVVTWAQ